MRRALMVLGLLTLSVASGCARSSRTHTPSASVPGTCVAGSATYYSDKLAGHATANGEKYDPSEHTAAALDFRMGTRVRVTWGERSVEVRVNDRGPFSRDGVIDLSRAAAEELGMIRAGRVPVRVCAL